MPPLSETLLAPLILLAPLALSPDTTVCQPGKSAEPENPGSADFPGWRRKCQEYSVASLNMKNLISPTPRN